MPAVARDLLVRVVSVPKEELKQGKRSVLAGGSHSLRGDSDAHILNEISCDVDLVPLGRAVKPIPQRHKSEDVLLLPDVPSHLIEGAFFAGDVEVAHLLGLVKPGLCDFEPEAGLGQRGREGREVAILEVALDFPTQGCALCVLPVFFPRQYVVPQLLVRLVETCLPETLVEGP